MKGAGVQDARGDAGIHATIKSAPQEAGRRAEIREGYYRPANSSLSLGRVPLHIPLSTLIWPPPHTHTHRAGRTKPIVTHSTETREAITRLAIQ